MSFRICRVQVSFVFASLILFVVCIGCGSAVTSNSSSGPSKTMTGLVVSPSNPNVVAGKTQQFAATATYSDGSTADLTATAAWSSSSTSVATVGSGGMATAVASGSTTITASASGLNGTTTLTVPAAAVTLKSIAIAPATAAVAVGATQQFTATGTYSDGSTGNVSSQATWSTTDTAVATINSTGVATAVAAGSTTVTASLNGVSGTATITVPAATLTSIAISPATPSIAVGATQQFTATGTYSDGSSQNVTSTATWSSSKTSIATISASGLATAVAASSTTITATVGGISGTATLTVAAAVTSPTLTSIAISPSAPSIAVGATQQFTATATYSDNSNANVTSTVTWNSAKTSVATISAAGLATGVAAGSSTITASLSGVSGTGTLTVKSATKTISSIAISPGTASIAVGATQQFTATATYSDNSTANVSSTVSWVSSNTSAATINSAGLATATGTGNATISASLNSVTGTAMLTLTAAKTVKSIAVAPATASVAMGGTQQFTATATYTDNSTANVSSSANWTATNTAIATVDSSGVATGVASGSTAITAALNGVSGSATLTVTTATVSGVSITTWHVDNERSGLNSQETSLTTSNVAPATFGKLFSYQVDGYAYGEPLIVSNVNINGGTHNVLYVATEHDDVYAFDADNYGSGTPLWHVSLLKAGETPQTSGPIKPDQGVTSTPVIDASSNTMYVVSAQIQSGGPTFRLNALDITTGAQKFGGPVTIHASVPGTNSSSVNGVVTLNNSCIQRSALLLANGNIYVGFGSCHSGWLLAYNAKTLAQVAVWNASPNLNGEGTFASAGGVWMGSGGPVADSSGNIYVTTGNGPWDGKTSFADSVMKFNSTLQVQDYFTPFDYQYMDCNDSDLAAGGLMMLPGTSELVSGGKGGKLYLNNAGNLGHEQANDAGATQTLYFEPDLIAPYSASCIDSLGTHTTTVNSYEIFGTAAWFNGSIYLGVTPTSSTAANAAGVRRFSYSGGKLTAGAYTTPAIQQDNRGTTPFISSNGTSEGILWMIDEGQPLQSAMGTKNATLRAYDATNLTNELYDSNANSADVPGYGIKFSSPVVANGKAYISTGHDPITATNPNGEIDVYGLK